MPATAPSYDDLVSAAQAEAQVIRPDLTFIDGDVSTFVSHGQAGMADQVVGYAINRFAALSLDTATGDDLTVLVDDRYNLQRKDASSATTLLQFSRPTDAEGAGVVAAGSVVATTADSLGNTVQFSTDVDVAFGATDLMVQVTATAVTAGPAGNLAGGSLTTVVSTLFDTSITVTQVTQAAGGADQEDDITLRSRVRAYGATLARGTLAALEFGAKLVAGVSLATAIDVPGSVTVYVADQSGNSSPSMTAAVALELYNWRCAGVTCQVVGASVLTLTGIVVSLTVRAGTDVGTLTANIQSAIVARLNRLKIGEAATQAQLLQATLNVDSDNILDASIAVTLPTPNPAQLVRTVLTNITVQAA